MHTFDIETFEVIRIEGQDAPNAMDVHRGNQDVGVGQDGHQVNRASRKSFRGLSPDPARARSSAGLPFLSATVRRAPAEWSACARQKPAPAAHDVDTLARKFLARRLEPQGPLRFPEAI